VFLQQQPHLKQAEFYDEGYYRGRSQHKKNLDNENVLEPDRIRGRLESCRGVVDLVTHHCPKPGRWLDIGCGPGFLLSQAQVQGWQCTGLEPSPFATSYARDQFGIEDVRTTDVDKATFPKNSFDVISMQHVLEHFRDPLATMDRVLAWLKSGGLLYVETPDVGSPLAQREGPNWEHLKIPEHLFYFSERTLRLLCAKINCEVIFVKHPVKGTGLLNVICGGEDPARNFYDRFKYNPIFQMVVRSVRQLNELYRTVVKKESDIIHILAKKTHNEKSKAHRSR
jgi:SAM-dependent methyltransferase